MDVALDSNELLSDPRMGSVRFQSLLAYLRKTQSRLLIPKIVWDEVIARYPERISEPHKKAVNAVKVLRSLLLSSKVSEVPRLELEKEVAALTRKLLRPTAYVRSVILRNFGDVPVEEIARRGIERIPPASQKGEELRDVMVWLMVVEHAKKSDHEIGFISQDEHFREGDVLHPTLQHDLEDGQIKLHFYKGIDDFIKAHAPAPRQLTEDEAYQLRSKQFLLDLFEIEARRFFPRYWGATTEVEITDRTLQFVKAALYDVGGSQYGEMEVSGTLRATLFTPEYASYINMGSYSPATVDQKGLMFSTVVDRTVVEDLERSWWRIQSKPVLEVPAIRFAEPLMINPMGVQEVPIYPVTTKRRREGVLSGRMAITFRVVSNRVTKVEVERFDITQFRAVSPDRLKRSRPSLDRRVRKHILGCSFFAALLLVAGGLPLP